jgi:transcriptional regulator with XRE-family HTH domain
MQQKHTPLKSPDDFATLSEYVTYVREIRGYSLRDVVADVTDAITNKTLGKQSSLSRGYISKLEAGKCTSPSPFKLQALAQIYRIPYETLLRKAGYLTTTCDKFQQDTTFTLMLKEVQTMTQEEQRALFEYIDFVKSKRRKRRCSCQQ